MWAIEGAMWKKTHDVAKTHQEIEVLGCTVIRLFISNQVRNQGHMLEVREDVLLCEKLDMN
jgi:hypothetical protein